MAKLGRDVVKQVEELAQKSPDPEVKQRARAILREISAASLTDANPGTWQLSLTVYDPALQVLTVSRTAFEVVDAKGNALTTSGGRTTGVNGRGEFEIRCQQGPNVGLPDKCGSRCQRKCMTSASPSSSALNRLPPGPPREQQAARR
jgi:hypothetical protein